jgi:predicted nuclease of restriction endonuclease-like RecB superfamily
LTISIKYYIIWFNGGDVKMILSEKEFKELCKKMGKTPKVIQNKQKIEDFDSLAEQNFYNLYILNRLKTGEIADCKLHNEFTIVDEIKEYNLRKKVFKPDFFIAILKREC